MVKFEVLNEYGFEDYISDENVEFYEEITGLRRNKAVLIERGLAGGNPYCEVCNSNYSEFKIIKRKSKNRYSLEYCCGKCLPKRLREILR